MSFYDDASLVLIPSGYKAGKVYSQKPLSTNGELTFTRASHATRVNVNGYVEKATQNLLTYSKNLASSGWAGSFCTSASAADFDGGNNANELTSTSVNGFWYQSISVTGVHTISVYAKAGTGNELRLRVDQSSSFQAYFDLSNGTITSGAGYIDATITAVSGASGWYRCTITGVIASPNNIRVYPATNQTLIAYKIQLEQGLVARDYIETTTAAVEGGIYNDVPRLDYSGGASCPALLLEPQRTNSLKHSEYYATGSGAINSWVYVNSPALTFNTLEVTSPEGLYNATKITGNGSSGLYQTAPVTGTCARSVYLRSVSGSTSVVIKDPVQTITSKTLNLTTEWQRYELIEDNTNGGSSGIWIDDISSSGIYMWGAQVEAGSYATSYIPTYGSAVTRSNDLCYQSSAPDTTGIKQYRITFEVGDTTDEQQVIQLYNATAGIGLGVTVGALGSAGVLGSRILEGSTTHSPLSWSGLLKDTKYELLFTVDWVAKTISNATLNGVSPDGTTIARVSNTEGLYLGSRFNAYYMAGDIKKFLIVEL